MSMALSEDKRKEYLHSLGLNLIRSRVEAFGDHDVDDLPGVQLNSGWRRLMDAAEARVVVGMLSGKSQ